MEPDAKYLESINRWLQGAEDTVDDIGGPRRGFPEHTARWRARREGFSVNDSNWAWAPLWLSHVLSESPSLIRLIDTQFSEFNSTPIREIYEAMKVYDDYLEKMKDDPRPNSEKQKEMLDALPDQETLNGWLKQAEDELDALARALRARIGGVDIAQTMRQTAERVTSAAVEQMRETSQEAQANVDAASNLTTRQKNKRLRDQRIIEIARELDTNSVAQVTKAAKQDARARSYGEPISRDVVRQAIRR